MRQYAVIANLEDTREGQYTMTSLPLHVTFLSIFFSNESASFFARINEEIAKGTHAIRVITTGRTRYGAHQEIPVTLVEEVPEIANLHNQLLDRVSAHTSFRAPQFTGANFKPHVTDQGERVVSVGTQLELNNLTLVEIEEQDVIVRSMSELIDNR